MVSLIVFVLAATGASTISTSCRLASGRARRRQLPPTRWTIRHSRALTSCCTCELWTGPAATTMTPCRSPPPPPPLAAPAAPRASTPSTPTGIHAHTHAIQPSHVLPSGTVWNQQLRSETLLVFHKLILSIKVECCLQGWSEITFLSLSKSGDCSVSCCLSGTTKNHLYQSQSSVAFKDGLKSKPSNYLSMSGVAFRVSLKCVVCRSKSGATFNDNWWVAFQGQSKIIAVIYIGCCVLFHFRPSHVLPSGPIWKSLGHTLPSSHLSHECKKKQMCTAALSTVGAAASWAWATACWTRARPATCRCAAGRWSPSTGRPSRCCGGWPPPGTPTPWVLGKPRAPSPSSATSVSWAHVRFQIWNHFKEQHNCVFVWLLEPQKKNQKKSLVQPIQTVFTTHFFCFFPQNFFVCDWFKVISSSFDISWRNQTIAAKNLFTCSQKRSLKQTR